MKDKNKLVKWMYISMLVFYLSGLFLIPSTDLSYLTRVNAFNDKVYADNDEWLTSDEYSMDIKGIGKVVTYRELYCAPIIFCIWFIIASAKYGEESLPMMIGIIGILLIYLTTKDKIIPTICFWVSLIAFYIGINTDTQCGENKRQSADKICENEMT